MPIYHDFIIKYKDGVNIGEEVLKQITIDRVKIMKKPSILFIGGDSGEGKSWTALRIMEICGESIDLDGQVIYTPFEYSRKMKNFLYDKKYKNTHFLAMMEARELVSARNWHSFVNKTINDVNAIVRVVKPIVFICVSQDINDLDLATRRMVNYYGFCVRPKYRKPYFYLYRVVKTRWVLENPKIVNRNLRGIIERNGEREEVEVAKFIVKKPNKVITKQFEKLDFNAKVPIIKAKLDALTTALEKDLPKITKIEALVESMLKEPYTIKFFTKRSREGKLKLRDEMKIVFDLSNEEKNELEKILIEKLKERGLVEVG
ncbi:MAG: hypothetical protein QW156_04385 [Candidatus Aenigmatarchaeota archaeon]